MEKNESLLKDQNKLVDEAAKVTEGKNAGKSSPARQARRLKKSRDTWKYKNKESKEKIKSLVIKTRDLGESRKNWKERAQQAEAELEEVRTTLPQVSTGETPQKKPE